MPVNINNCRVCSFYKTAFIKRSFVLIANYFLLSSSFCFAQRKEIDSLQKVLPSLKDTARINCLNELAFEYSNPYWNAIFKVQIDTALLYLRQALKEAKYLKYSPGIGASFQNLGMVAEQRGNFIESERYTLQAIALLEKTNRQTELERAFVNLGWCAINEGRYNEALYILNNSLRYYLRIKDTSHIAMIYRMIGNTYINMGYTERAFNYFQMNNRIKKTSSDILGAVYSPEFKAKLYLIAGDTAKAIYYLQQKANSVRVMKLDIYNEVMSQIFRLTYHADSSLYYLKEIIRSIKTITIDSLVRNRILITQEKNMADIFMMLNNYDEVLAHSWKPLQAFAAGGNINMLMAVLHNIAKAYEGKRNDAKALYYTKQMLDYAERNGARPWMQESYFLLWRIYRRQNIPKLRYKYLLKYTSIKNAIEIENYKAKILAWDAITIMTAAENNYETQLKTTEERNEARILLMKNEKRRLYYIFISAIIISLLFAGFLFRNIKLKRRKDQLQFLMVEADAQLEKRKIEQEVAELQLQKKELEMQALRSQMNPHFIFNSLSAINMFILENNKLKASEYLSKFSRLIRLILQNSDEAFIPLERELEALQLYLDLESLRFENKFTYKIIAEEDLDTTGIKVPPLIMQPYVENAIWHGLMHKKEKGNLEIELYVQEEILFLKITDDGIGRKRAAELKSKSTLTHKSMGMRITADRIAMLQQLNQKETFIAINDLVLPDGSAGGTEVIIKIPVHYD